jgi:hypothetical protein
MSEFQRTTPSILSADQQAPVVFMDIQDGRLVKMIMTREEAEARRAAAASQDIHVADDQQAPLLAVGETHTPASTDDGTGFGATKEARVLPERRSGGLSAKKTMAKLAVAAMVILPYPIGDTISTFLQSGNTPSLAMMAEDITQLPSQSVEFYQGVLATIQGAKSFTDTINNIKGNK